VGHKTTLDRRSKLLFDKHRVNIAEANTTLRARCQPGLSCSRGSCAASLRVIRLCSVAVCMQKDDVRETCKPYQLRLVRCAFFASNQAAWQSREGKLVWTAGLTTTGQELVSEVR
jgi:hypothetical protein